MIRLIDDIHLYRSCVSLHVTRQSARPLNHSHVNAAAPAEWEHLQKRYEKQTGDYEHQPLQLEVDEYM